MAPLSLTDLVVLATEGGIPPSNPWAKLAVPIGIVIFIGSVYMLLRANLGTKRGYLVMSTALWGFMVIYALFWTFGAPGTPPTTGPQNLPGQPADAYLPVWVPFAEDSNVAAKPEYAGVVSSYPQGFGPVAEDFAEIAQEGADEILNLFSTLAPPPIAATWEPVEILQATATNGYPVIAVTYQETYQASPTGELPAGEIGTVNPDGKTYTAFAFFDAGSPLFPSLIVVALSLLLFAVHAWWLDRDEQRERRELGESAPPSAAEPEPEPVEVA